VSVAWKQHRENSRDNRRSLVSSCQQLWAWLWIQSMLDFMEFFRGLIMFQWTYWAFFLESFLGFWLCCVQTTRDFPADNNSCPESVVFFSILWCCRRFWIYVWNLPTTNPKDSFICHFDQKIDKQWKFVFIQNAAQLNVTSRGFWFLVSLVWFGLVWFFFFFFFFSFFWWGVNGENP